MGYVSAARAASSATARPSWRGVRPLLVPAHRPTTLACVLVSLLSLGIAPLALAAGDANVPACPQQTESSPGFRSYLPDCRAYELVTPPYTQGAKLQWLASSPDGSRVLASSDGTFAGDETSLPGVGSEGGPSYGVNYELTRTGSGWAAASIEPPASDPRFRLHELVAASADLTSTLWAGSSSAPSEASTALYDLYRREEHPGGEPSFTQIGPAGTFAGASADLSHILLTRAPGDLFPGDETQSGPSLYEYAQTGQDEPRLVGVTNEGPLEGSPNVNDSAHLIGRCGTELGSGREDTYNAISSSGETVFFTVLQGSCSAPTVNELYARIGGAKTIDISEPRLPAGETCEDACATAPRQEGLFQGASSDGSKVFFLTDQPLLTADRDTTQDLYEAEISDGTLTHLTMVSEGEREALDPEYDDPTPGQGAEVLGVVRVSQDGSHVYFVAHGLLTREPRGGLAGLCIAELDESERLEEEHTHEGRCSPRQGARNLYVFDTLTHRTAFVAALQSPAEEAAAQSDCESNLEEQACRDAVDEAVIWTPRDSRAAQASSDGEFLAFSSLAHLTPDDSSGPMVPQLFEYDTSDGALSRVSVSSHGFGEDGNTTSALDAPRLPAQSFVATAPPTTASFSQALTDQGVVFFESAEPLVPEALSEANNIYEYTGGEAYLISDGQDTTRGPLGESDVELIGADASGQDVFFTTVDRLVPQATGTQIAWYDARAAGGFPVRPPPSLCEACQAPAGFTPLISPPASSQYKGGEELHPAPTHTTPKPLTRAQSLAQALRACRSRPRRRRGRCEANARSRYRAGSSKTPRGRRATR